MNPQTHLGDAAKEIFSRALAACSVENAFASRLQPGAGDQPYAFTLRGSVGEPPVEVDLTGFRRIIVIAAGKGAATMLQGLLRRIRTPAECQVLGVLTAPEPPLELPEGIEYFCGGHPLPSEESFAAARASLSLIQDAVTQADVLLTFCFFLLSGGASAMMELPLDESISLEDTIAFHRSLVHSGASITEINCVRKHFSAIKGGRLGQAAAFIPNLTILVSDVPSGQLDALASGPTLPDRSTLSQCHGILKGYDLLRRFPASVQRFFSSSFLPETPKPGSFPTRIVTLLSSDDLAESARLIAESLGFAVVIDDTCDDWDYRAAAEYLITRFRNLRRQYKKLCLIVSGEVTVTLSPQAGQADPGVGGRNQHFALYAATLLEASDRPTVIFSAGSDGIDGNSPFAGAVIDYDSTKAGNQYEAADNALQRFDSSTFLDLIRATITTGPTGNNLRDLRLFVVE